MDGNGLLFSFHRHDFKSKEIDGVKYFIDGGFDYTRASTNGTIKTDTIENMIPYIRKVFKWGSNYDKFGKRLPKTKYRILKNLTTSHIINIIEHLGNSSKIVEIFKQELKFRNETRNTGK